MYTVQDSWVVRRQFKNLNLVVPKQDYTSYPTTMQNCSTQITQQNKGGDLKTSWSWIHAQTNRCTDSEVDLTVDKDTDMSISVERRFFNCMIQDFSEKECTRNVN